MKFEIKPFAFQMLWHKRRDTDAAQRWLRHWIIRFLQENECVENKEPHGHFLI